MRRSWKDLKAVGSDIPHTNIIIVEVIAFKTVVADVAVLAFVAAVAVVADVAFVAVVVSL